MYHLTFNSSTVLPLVGSQRKKSHCGVYNIQYNFCSVSEGQVNIVGFVENSYSHFLLQQLYIVPLFPLYISGVCKLFSKETLMVQVVPPCRRQGHFIPSVYNMSAKHLATVSAYF